MSFEDIKISEFNQHHKSGIEQFIIQADLKYQIENIDGCKNDPEH